MLSLTCTRSEHETEGKDWNEEVAISRVTNWVMLRFEHQRASSPQQPVHIYMIMGSRLHTPLRQLPHNAVFSPARTRRADIKYTRPSHPSSLVHRHCSYGCTTHHMRNQQRSTPNSCSMSSRKHYVKNYLVLSIALVLLACLELADTIAMGSTANLDTFLLERQHGICGAMS
jgi:hypothetical protein